MKRTNRCVFLSQETRLREGIVKLQPHEEPLRSELLSGKFTVLVSSCHIRAISSRGLFMLFKSQKWGYWFTNEKNTVSSFISTPKITAAESLMQFHFNFQPVYYNKVSISENVQKNNFAWCCSAICQMSVRSNSWLDATESGSLWFIRYLHRSSSSSCLLSSHPAICIYNPERRIQVPRISWWVIGLLKICYWHKYLINGNALCLHIRKWVGWKRINQI